MTVVHLQSKLVHEGKGREGSVAGKGRKTVHIVDL